MAARTISTSLLRVSALGAIRGDLSPYLTDGRIEMNTDREAGKLSGSFTLSDGDLISPYADFLIPRLTIEYDDGRPTLGKRLGFYMTRTAPASRTIERHEATYQVEDLTRFLSLSAYTSVSNVASGTGINTALTATMVEAGTNRYSFPATGKSTTKKLTYPIGTTRLEKVNDLLRSIGYYEAYPRLDGRITSKPYVDLASAQPVMTITDDDVLAAIDLQSNDQTLVNVVIAVRDDPSQATLSAVARNDDPASPTSTVSVGFEYTRVERVSDVQSQTELDNYAARLLREARTYYQTATIRVWPDVDFGIHEVVDLDLTGELAALNGRWWVRRWSLGLTPGSCYYDLEVNRVTDTVNGVTI